MTEERAPEGVRTVTLEAAARQLGISVQAARTLARENRFPCRVIQMGPRFYRVPVADLDALLAPDPVAQQ